MMIPFAILCGLTLGCAALSLLALYHAKTLALIGGQKAQKDREQRQSAFEQMRQRLDGVAEELRDLREQPVASAAMATPRASLNLNKRSQALRLHRRGDSPEQIAAALEVPRQEVDLLIKVHRIATNGA